MINNSKQAIVQFKLAAIRLQKLILSMQSQQAKITEDILERLAILSEYKLSSPLEKQAYLARISLADCKEIIAREQGEDSWQALLQRCNESSISEGVDDYLIYDNHVSNGCLNVWFPTYSEAKLYQQSKKRLFLFPYKNTFFVCTSSHLHEMGVDANDIDWKNIGYDWAYPQDGEAKSRLRLKFMHAWQARV
jgi:hypothetical protein